MLIGSMTEHLIHHHLETEFPGPLRQPVKILQSSEHRIHRAIVANVVAEIFHRRLEERRHPKAINPQPGNVIELFGNARQVADAISIAVRETSRIDLIDDSAAPPFVLRASALPFVSHNCLASLMWVLIERFDEGAQRSSHYVRS